MWLQFLYALIPLGIGAPAFFVAARGKVGKGASFGARAIEQIAQESQNELPAAKSVDALVERKGEGAKRFGAELRKLEQRALENSSNNIYGYLHSLIGQLQKLEEKLTRNGVDQNARLAYAKYNPLISKIVELSSPNYYGDFIDNPENWNDPRRMRIQVELSVLAVTKEAGDDIRKLNSSEELNFQVTAESLIGKAAGAAKDRDGESQLLELLTEHSGPVDKATLELNDLSKALELEVRSAAERRAEEAKLQADEVAIQAELAKAEARKYLGGSREDIENGTDEQSIMRPVVLSKELFKQTYTIYGPKPGAKKDHLVGYSNAITGKKSWKTFTEVYQAAEWLDRQVDAEEQKHGYNCGCVYCR